MDINKKILTYIKENGIIQSELSKKLGYTQANLSRILNSDDIKFSQLEKICEALSLPITFFINNSSSYSTKEIEGINKQIDVLDKNYSSVLTELKEERHKHAELLKVFLDLIINSQKGDASENENIRKNMVAYLKSMTDSATLNEAENTD